MSIYLAELVQNDPLTAMSNANNMLYAMADLIGGRDNGDITPRTELGIAILLRSIVDIQDALFETFMLEAADKRANDRGAYDTARGEFTREWGEMSEKALGIAQVREIPAEERLRQILGLLGIGKLYASSPDQEGTQPSETSLTARDAAIAETYRRGYGVSDIARAVNLKEQSVQNIISRLQEAGELPASAGRKAASA